MRVYFEKPRTTLGWKGLLNDPHLDGSYKVNEGLQIGRRLMLDILSLGLPVGGEFLDPISAQYFADLVSWGSIGARTAESQVHRQLSSGLSMPVGIKNGTDGDVQVAITACAAAAASHVFTSINPDGVAAIFWTRATPTAMSSCAAATAGPTTTPGRSTTRWRGWAGRAACPAAGRCQPRQQRQGLPASSRDVIRDVVAQRAAGQRRHRRPDAGELSGGGPAGPGPRQGTENLRYGQSVTDPCLGWEETAGLLCEVSEQLS